MIPIESCHTVLIQGTDALREEMGHLSNTEQWQAVSFAKYFSMRFKGEEGRRGAQPQYSLNSDQNQGGVSTTFDLKAAVL